MANERLTLPKLPPGKRVEQVLAMREKDFAEVARGAGMEPEALRETLQKILARSSQTGRVEEAEALRARKKKKTQLKEGADEPTMREARYVLPTSKNVVKGGLARFFMEDVPTDDKSIEERKAKADAEYSKAEKKYTKEYETPSPSGRRETYVDIPPAVKDKLERFYQAAHESRIMRYVRDLEAQGKNWQEARQAAFDEFRWKAREINLSVESFGFATALRKLEACRWRKSVEEARSLYDALRSGTSLNQEQQIFLANLMSAAKRIEGKGKLSYLRADPAGDPAWLQYCVALEWQQLKPNRSSGSGGFDTDASGGSGYDRSRSRPRRDMYGSYGGEDDK